MPIVWLLFSCLFSAALVSAGHSSPLSAVERYLYVQLEDTLVNDAATLEQLREVFFQKSSGPSTVDFKTIITADYIPASNCSASSRADTCEPAFCPATSDNNASTAQWELCSYDRSYTVRWEVPHGVDAQDLINVLGEIAIPLCTHGLSTAAFITSFWFRSDSNEGTNYGGEVTLKLRKLDCQPCKYQLINAVGEFFSWVSATVVMFSLVSQDQRTAMRATKSA